MPVLASRLPSRFDRVSRRLFASVAAVSFAIGLASAPGVAWAAEPRQVSGIRPQLAMFNNEGECGTGAVVPWADRLWVITYAPHKPEGSSDKLYEITPALEQIVRPESVGGTPANRLIHRESGQLFIGPYAIDRNRGLRVIPSKTMYGRLTGIARHLTEPVQKICYATMEEGVYEVDVTTLAVKELWADEQRSAGRHAELPGYHGKGFYSGQGRYVYANNGDHAKQALSDPRTPSGVLAEWDGKAPAWTVVRRNQFTEVTGPGGIEGNRDQRDPLWSIGWDHRSLILMLLDGGQWRAFRLPKASHSYDGAHGWNTEWPRIRDIGAVDLLMTMHGMFWRFPRTFSAANTAGVRPRSAYLKVVGDFCRWNDRLVFGCDDAAKSEFLNKRKVKGAVEGPGQSQSNLWFTEPSTPDRLGPSLASGAVWLREAVKAGDVSDPLLFAGWPQRSAHFVNEGSAPAAFALEVDPAGKNEWTALRTVAVAASETVWVDFSEDTRGEWIRVRAMAGCERASAHFAFSDRDSRGVEPDAIFHGLAEIGDGSSIGGLVRCRGDNKRTLALAALATRGSKVDDLGAYELDGALQLKPLAEASAQSILKTKLAIPRNVVSIDEASALVVDDRGRRWRFPKTSAVYDGPTRAGQLRLSREATTERDLFSLCGTFYELPAENADGFAKIRPIATHGFRVMDYCSYRGLLVMTGTKPDAPSGEHILRSADGAAALWVGAIDDLWKLGRPRGAGGPWREAAVKAGQPSDPYLCWGFVNRRLELAQNGPAAVTIRVEADLTGEGFWIPHRSITLAPGQRETYEFPAAFQARWLRLVADRDCVATAMLSYD